jgi:hypothetical protein
MGANKPTATAKLDLKSIAPMGRSLADFVLTIKVIGVKRPGLSFLKPAMLWYQWIAFIYYSEKNPCALL